jgi:hypothetical protein
LSLIVISGYYLLIINGRAGLRARHVRRPGTAALPV